MFEIKVVDVFKITGRGYVISGEILIREVPLKNGSILVNKDDFNQKIHVKSIAMINWGPGNIKLNHIDLLANITDEEAESLNGKILQLLN